MGRGIESLSMLRLFIATDPDAILKERMEDVVVSLKAPNDGVKWVRLDGIHLTIKFFGNIDEKEIPNISEVSNSILKGVGDIKLKIRGLGTFPGGNRPRVIWVGIGGEVDRLAKVKGDIEDALYDLGYPKEERSFNPHLTLGRVKGRLPVMILEKIKEMRDVEVGDMVVGGFHLFKSDLRPTGAVYTPLEYYSLK
jgi:2'-5' RNA ligase